MGFLKSVTAPFNPTSWGSSQDPIFGGPLGDLIPGIGDARAQDRANDQNTKLYYLNREWSERMSNTAYQRAMDDMKRAGLNPMLAYQQGGASVPNVNTPEMGASSKTGLVSSAVKAYTGISTADAQKMQAQTAQAQANSTMQLQTAQTAKEVAQTDDAKAAADLKRAETALKQRELRGKGIKDTLDREGGSVIQKLIDKLKSSAKDVQMTPAEIQRARKSGNSSKILNVKPY